jgi:hypothetical protein
VLDEFATGQQGDRGLSGKALRLASPDDRDDVVFYGTMPPITHMLSWLVRHHPDSARHTIGEIIGEAERCLDIPREVSERSLSAALSLDGMLDKATRKEFLNSVLTPGH